MVLGVSNLLAAGMVWQGWSTMYLLAILDSVLKNIGEACAVLVIYAAQAGAGPRAAMGRAGGSVANARP